MLDITYLRLSRTNYLGTLVTVKKGMNWYWEHSIECTQVVIGSFHLPIWPLKFSEVLLSFRKLRGKFSIECFDKLVAVC